MGEGGPRSRSRAAGGGGGAGKVARPLITPRALLEILWEAALEWDKDHVSRLAAALAYYTVFSLAPLLVIAVSVAGFLFGEEAARGEIVRQIEGLIGSQSARIVEDLIQDAGADSGQGLLATLLGLVALLIGATGAYVQIQGGLNTVWEVAPRPRNPFRNLLRNRLISFAMVLVTGFLLLVSLVLSAALEAFGGYLEQLVPGLPLWLLNPALSLAMITFLFAGIYRILPDAEIPWSMTWLGAIVTALLFTLGKQLIGLYLGNSSAGSAYGAAGTLVILLVWVYYSAQIFYFGAEITQVYTRRVGRPIRPSPYATRMVRVRVEAEDAEEAARLAIEAVRRSAVEGEGEE